MEWTLPEYFLTLEDVDLLFSLVHPFKTFHLSQKDKDSLFATLLTK